MSLALETIEELAKPQFVNSDVMQATGRSAATLQSWVNRGVLLPASGQNPGVGQRRLYSAIDVVKLAVLGELTDFGLLPAAARKVVEFVGRKLSENGELPGILRMYRRKPTGAWDFQVKGRSLELIAAEPTSLVLPVGMIVAMTLRALRMILGEGEIVSECEVVSGTR